MRAQWTREAEYDAAAGTTDKAAVDCWVEDQFHSRRAWSWVEVADRTFEVDGIACKFRVRIGGSMGQLWVIERLTVTGGKHVREVETNALPRRSDPCGRRGRVRHTLGWHRPEGNREADRGREAGRARRRSGLGQ